MTRRSLFLVHSTTASTAPASPPQCRLLAEWLRRQGRDVVSCIDPGGTELGGELRRAIVLSHKGQMGPGVRGAAVSWPARAPARRGGDFDPRSTRARSSCPTASLLANVVYSGTRRLAGRGFSSGKSGRLATGGLEPDATFSCSICHWRSPWARRGRPADRMGEPIRGVSRARSGKAFLAEARRRPERIHVHRRPVKRR